MRDRKSRRRSNQRERAQLNRRPFKTLWTNLKVALLNNHQFCHETQKLKNKERFKSMIFLMILSKVTRKRRRLTRSCQLKIQKVNKNLKNSKTKNKTQRSVLNRGNQFQKRNSKKEKMSKSRDLGLLWRVNRKRRKLNSKSCMKKWSTSTSTFKLTTTWAYNLMTLCQRWTRRPLSKWSHSIGRIFSERPTWGSSWQKFCWSKVRSIRWAAMLWMSFAKYLSNSFLRKIASSTGKSRMISNNFKVGQKLIRWITLWSRPGRKPTMMNLHFCTSDFLIISYSD